MLGNLFGGGQQTVSTAPWQAQQPYLQQGFEQAGELLNRPDFDPAQLQGFDMAQQYAQSMQPMIGGAQNALNTAFNAADVNNNPYLASAAQAAARPLTQNLTENILPQIRSGAGQAGQYGSSRQGIAEGIAARGTQQAIGDQTANMYSQAYGQGLNTMMNGISQAGNVANLGLMPSQIMQGIGQQRHQQPMQNLQQYMQTVGGNYGGTQTTPTGSPLPALIGGGAGLLLGGGNPAAGQLGMAMGGLLS